MLATRFIRSAPGRTAFQREVCQIRSVDVLSLTIVDDNIWPFRIDVILMSGPDWKAPSFEEAPCFHGTFAKGATLGLLA